MDLIAFSHKGALILLYPVLGALVSFNLWTAAEVTEWRGVWILLDM